MNCKNFEAIIPDLARGQMLEAHMRESALTHVEECEACARMLEMERALTRGLRSLAASMEQREAPATVEANLLARFRERTVAPQQSPVVVEMPQRASTWRRWYPQAVAAAVLLMFAIGGASMLRMRQEQKPASGPREVASGKSDNQPAQATPADSTPSQPDQAVTGDVQTPEIARAGSDETRTERGQMLTRSEVVAIMGTTSAQRRNGYQSVPKSSVNRSGMSQTGGEIATEFMPVSYGDNLNDIEQGRIVRVEMPRSALAQFGLPVNMDRANERIKADVLIGDDGMARAIRFVK